MNEEFAAPFISPVEPPCRAKLRSTDGRFSSELQARLRGGSARWITVAIGTSLILVILGVAAIVS